MVAQGCAWMLRATHPSSRSSNACRRRLIWGWWRVQRKTLLSAGDCRKDCPSRVGSVGCDLYCGDVPRAASAAAPCCGHAAAVLTAPPTPLPSAATTVAGAALIVTAFSAPYMQVLIITLRLHASAHHHIALACKCSSSHCACMQVLVITLRLHASAVLLPSAAAFTAATPCSLSAPLPTAAAFIEASSIGCGLHCGDVSRAASAAAPCCGHHCGGVDRAANAAAFGCNHRRGRGPHCHYI